MVSEREIRRRLDALGASAPPDPPTQFYAFAANANASDAKAADVWHRAWRRAPKPSVKSAMETVYIMMLKPDAEAFGVGVVSPHHPDYPDEADEDTDDDADDAGSEDADENDENDENEDTADSDPSEDE